MHHFKVLKDFFFFAYFITVTAANNPADDTAGIKYNRKYFLPRGEIEKYNLFIDVRNFYDQPINDLIKPYDKVRTR